MARRKEPTIPDAILDQLLAGADAKTAFDPGGLLDGLKKALAERALNAEMDHHLGGPGGAGNSRNGYGSKTVITDAGKLSLDVPRDRQASFDPMLIAKYQRRFPGFDDKVISMYARGMSNREIVGHLGELYGIDVSPDLISVVTDAVLEEIAAWQARPLEPVYPLVFFDALRVKIRDEGLVRNKAVHVALGVRHDGGKEFVTESFATLRSLRLDLEPGASGRWLPGIDHCDTAAGEIGDIAGRDNHATGRRDRSDLTIGFHDRPPGGPTLGEDIGVGTGRGAVER